MAGSASSGVPERVPRGAGSGSPAGPISRNARPTQIGKVGDLVPSSRTDAGQVHGPLLQPQSPPPPSKSRRRRSPRLRRSRRPRSPRPSPVHHRRGPRASRPRRLHLQQRGPSARTASGSSHLVHRGRRRRSEGAQGDTPGARQANTIRERNTNACEDFRRRDQRTSCSRSSPVNTNSALGRPVRATPRFYYLPSELRAHDTSGPHPAAPVSALTTDGQHVVLTGPGRPGGAMAPSPAAELACCAGHSGTRRIVAAKG